jgi:hypothetical protein
MAFTDETVFEINERQRALGRELRRMLPVYSSLPLDMRSLLDRIDRREPHQAGEKSDRRSA